MHSGIPFFNTHSCRKIIYTAARSHPLLPSSKRNSRGGFWGKRIHSSTWVSTISFSYFLFGLDIIHTTHIWAQHAAFDHRRDKNWDLFFFSFSFSAWHLFHRNHTHSHTQQPSARVVVLGLHMVSLDRQPELSAPLTSRASSAGMECRSNRDGNVSDRPPARQDKGWRAQYDLELGDRKPSEERPRSRETCSEQKKSERLGRRCFLLGVLLDMGIWKGITKWERAGRKKKLLFGTCI